MSNEFNNTSVGLDKTQLSGFPSFIPESLAFQEIKKGLPCVRTPIKTRTEQQSYASNNNKLIRFQFPGNTLYDTRNGYLTFDITLAKTGGTYIRVANGIASIINRVRILAGATEIEDIRDYNRIETILREIETPTLVTTNTGVNIMGYGTQGQRNALGAVTTSYAMTLASEFFNNELLPLDNIESAIVLELYLEDPTVCIETDGTVPIINFANGQFHSERLELDSSYRSYIKQYISSYGLKMGFFTWERYINQLSGGSQQNVMINHRSSSMNVLLNIFLNNSTINDPTVSDKFLTWLPLNLQTYQVNMNNRQYPDEPVDLTTANKFEAYQILCRWLMKWRLDGRLAVAPPIAYQNFIVDRFVFLDDFEAYPNDHVINPLNAVSQNTVIIKKLNFNGAIPANTQMDTWVQYFKDVVITKDGKVMILQ